MAPRIHCISRNMLVHDDTLEEVVSTVVSHLAQKPCGRSADLAERLQTILVTYDIKSIFLLHKESGQEDATL